MNLKLLSKHELSISIVANMIAIITAISSFFMSINLWVVTVIALIALVIVSIVLYTLNQRFKELEKQALSVAKSYYEFSAFTYQESLKDRPITFTELGYLSGVLKDIQTQMGKDTSEVDALLEKVMLLETESKARK